MHSHIKQLYNIANKNERYIIGLMSGTSLDGLDVALCKITNAGTGTKVELLNFDTVDYDSSYRNEIKSIFSRRDIDLQKLTIMNPWVGKLHGSMVLSCLKKWGINPSDVDIIASHGQTIYHAPKHLHREKQYDNATLQIGDGDHMACTTGIITLSDFRQKHIAAGGEGAPLAVYGDYFIFSCAEENRVMLNIGGIANFTYLPKNQKPDEVFSTDVGTGNTLMDAYVQAHFKGLSYDTDSKIASSGLANKHLLEALKNHAFFNMPMPRTIGPELFNLNYLHEAQTASGTHGLNHADVLATLNLFSADAITKSITKACSDLNDYEIYASGGGIYNKLLMETIQQRFPNKVIKLTQELGINPDAKEAVLFAVIANECIAGSHQNFGNIKEGIPPITMGKVSFFD